VALHKKAVHLRRYLRKMKMRKKRQLRRSKKTTSKMMTMMTSRVERGTVEESIGEQSLIRIM
jgi:hypothetical protein